jgi:putative MATE family efflux protein
MVYQSLARGVGDVKTPMYIVLVTVILNAVLDPLFIFGYKIIPAMGVSGAAVATILTQGIALFIGLGIFFSGKFGVHLKKSDLKPDYPLMKKIIKLGFPSSLEQSSRAIGFIVMTIIVASFGTVALASYGIGMRVISLVIMPALSLSIVNSTLVGQNFGAGKIDRAKKIIKISGIFGFILLSIIGILFFFFSTQIVSLFISSDPEVVKMGSLFIKIGSLFFGFIGIQMTLSGSFRGAGDTKITMVIAISVMIVQLGFAILLSKFTQLGTTGIWISMPIANLFGALISLIIYKQDKWSKKEIIK